MPWFKKRTTVVGSILYRSGFAPPLLAVERLAAGMEVEEVPVPDEARWMLKLRHPRWGHATLASLKDHDLPQAVLVDHDPALTEKERAAIRGARSALGLTLEGSREDVLRDRKDALRFMHAFLGADGVGLCDHVAQRIWSRDALDEELAHEAALDIDAIHVLHAVQNDAGKVEWLHSHGLAEIGFFDFDVLRPSDDLKEVPDVLRALSFHIVEASANAGESVTLLRPDGDVRLVPVAEFEDRADPADVRLRDDPRAEHRERRVVVCDPSAGWPRHKRLRPSRRLSQPLGERASVMYSAEASALMEDRARRTYGLLRRVAEELAEFELPILAKLAYRTDGDPDGSEHLWFEVERLFAEEVEATLLNAPYDIARLRPGERGRHPVEQLSDWAVQTPIGPIHPRSLVALRTIRTHRDAFRQAFAAARAGAPPDRADPVRHPSSTARRAPPSSPRSSRAT